MDIALPAAFALGFLSGFKHAFEPDHVIAVSTLLHDTLLDDTLLDKEPRFSRALRMGVAWGAGHTTTLVAGVLLISLMRVPLAASQLEYFELPVALMLLGLGGWALYDAVSHMLRLRRHRHDGIAHYHVGQHPHPHTFPLKRSGWQGYAIGLVHGLAGSGALLLLVAATLPTMTAGIVYALIFGVGSILGMGAVTLALALPFLVSRSRPLFYHALTGLSGTLSIVLGASIMYATWIH